MTVNATLFYENAGEAETAETSEIMKANVVINDFYYKIYRKNNSKDMKNTEFNAKQNVTYQSLRKLFELHDQLLDISEVLNKSYSPQIVTYITTSFVIILFGLFFEAKVKLNT